MPEPEQVYTIDCPVCDYPDIEHRFRKKEYYAACPFCGTRVYTSYVGMQRAMERTKKEAKHAGKTKTQA